MKKYCYVYKFSRSEFSVIFVTFLLVVYVSTLRNAKVFSSCIVVEILLNYSVTCGVRSSNIVPGGRVTYPEFCYGFTYTLMVTLSMISCKHPCLCVSRSTIQWFNCKYNLEPSNENLSLRILSLIVLLSTYAWPEFCSNF